METARCRAFLQAAETGSFSRAAEKLNYTLSTITWQMNQLEQELNVRLFEKIEMLSSLVVIMPMALFFALPTSVCIFYSMNMYTKNISDYVSWPMLIVVFSAVLVTIFGYRNNLHIIKDLIHEMRYYRNINS